MPRGLPSLRWSTEPKRRKVVVGTGVEEATCSSTSVPSGSQLVPKFVTGRSDAPVLRPSTRGDRGVAMASAPSAASLQLTLDGLLSSMSAPSAAGSQESLIKTWTSFHMAWFGSSVGVLQLLPSKVFAVCAMFRAGGYLSVENYLSRITDLHIGEGFDWSVEETVKRSIGPARQSAALNLLAALKALEDRRHDPVCDRGPVGLRNLIVVGCFGMLRELEVRCAKICHLEADLVHSWVDWAPPVSKTDVRTLGKVRRWECVCSPFPCHCQSASGFAELARR